MSTQPQPAGEPELTTFLEKLGQFHSILSPREQEILNEITVAAVGGSDVQGFANATGIGTILLASPTTGGANAAYYYKYYNAVAGALQAGGLRLEGGGGVGLR